MNHLNQAEWFLWKMLVIHWLTSKRSCDVDFAPETKSTISTDRPGQRETSIFLLDSRCALTPVVAHLHTCGAVSWLVGTNQPVLPPPLCMCVRSLRCARARWRAAPAEPPPSTRCPTPRPTPSTTRLVSPPRTPGTFSHSGPSIAERPVMDVFVS